MHATLYAQIQGEFSLIAHAYNDLEQAILADENLVTIQSKYNLYDIQPYYAQLANEVIPPDAKLLIEDEEDFDPATDDLFDYQVDLTSRKTFLRREQFGGGVFYGTVYEYNEQYYKSFTVYKNNDEIKTTHLNYLYFKDGLPHQYIECTEYGVSLKTYTCEGQFIKSYKLEWPNVEHHCIGDLTYDADGKLTTIIETASDGRSRTMFDASAGEKDIETVLSDLEEFLVENIADQILKNVNIEEPVYCILFEYTMQGPFPPTIAFGVTTELDGKFEDLELYELYNAPDMQYFSENDEPNPVNIDFYQLEIEPNYLACDIHGDTISWEDEEESELWAQQVKDTYLRVCKRLMHYDFSSCFTKSKEFLVMARDFEQCNEEEFYQELSEYKKERGL